MTRSVLAVVAGFFTIGLLSAGTDALLRALYPSAFAGGRVDDPMLLLLTIAYVGVFAIGGCYLTARLAPDRPMRHALVLGLLGLAFTVVGTIAKWHTAPAWYHLASLALVMPYAWLGGHLAERRELRAVSYEL